MCRAAGPACRVVFFVVQIAQLLVGHRFKFGRRVPPLVDRIVEQMIDQRLSAFMRCTDPAKEHRNARRFDRFGRQSLLPVWIAEFEWNVIRLKPEFCLALS